MRLSSILLCAATYGQSFDVASVKPSARQAGPDYNNQLVIRPDGFTARNATLRRLLAEAHRVQMNQILGPGWLDQNEYEIQAQAPEQVTREQMSSMLVNLLAERFQVKHHSETREMRVFELLAGSDGLKKSTVGLPFHGDMRAFADLIAVQLSIAVSSNPNQPSRAAGPPVPVLDKTGLAGIFEFSVDIKPDLGTDQFVIWQRALREQLGLRLESRRAQVPVIVIDSAARVPAAN